MLPRMKARTELAAYRAASAPHLKKEDRQSYRNGLEQRARLAKPKPIKATAADMAALGIHYEEVSADGREPGDSSPDP